MDLKHLKNAWEQLAREDPLWAILAAEDTRGGKWQLDEFFANGATEAGHALEVLPVMGRQSLSFERALDFGCGVGRMTQAYCDHAQEIVGIDISAPMIEKARAYNRHGTRCKYVLHQRDNLRPFADEHFDLVHSVLVLQHMAPRYARNYLREFMRVLRPGGVLLLQAASDFALATPTGARTEASGPLPPSAQRAQIEALPRLKLGTMDLRTLDVRVRNAGDRTWPALGKDDDHQVKLSARWTDANGARLDDEQTTLLPRDIAPGETVVLPLRVCAPAVRGKYRLQPDMLQVGSGWFDSAGLAGSAIKVDVVRASNNQPLDVEVYAMPRERVKALLQECGASVVRTRAEGSAGPDFVAHRYWVIK
jgi:SAM-dependent methyltransferase